MKTKIRLLTLIIAVLTIAAFAAPAINNDPAPAEAGHTWGSYHWARTSNPLNLLVGDNVTSTWDGHLNVAIADWNQSSVLNLTLTTGKARGKCRPTSGRVEVCNGAYGNTGWLGIAQIWASGNHITQGTAKMNDTYFNSAPYNTSAWRALVMCQEIGHDFGLGHQDENFDDPPMGTCMDYTSDPEPNQHPDSHDYQMLASIYSHTDSSNTASSNQGVMGAGYDHPSDWGQMVHSHGRSSVYVRDFGNGNRMITHVFWAN